MPRHYFFLADPQALAEQAAAEPADNGVVVKVPEWVNILPEPDGDGLILSRDNRVLHIDSLEKLAKRSNAALRKQGGGGPVDADHKIYGGWFMTGGGPALGWAEEFEYRPGKGLWSRTSWLPEGEKLISSRQYRYTSSVVSGETTPEVDEEAWTVTWHIYPELVEGFGITNIPALVTKAMFAERQRDERARDDMLQILLKKLGLRHDAELPEVREAFAAFQRRRFTSLSEQGAANDSPAPAPAPAPAEPATPTPAPAVPAAPNVEPAEPTVDDDHEYPDDGDAEEPDGDDAVDEDDDEADADEPVSDDDPATKKLKARIRQLEAAAGESFVESLMRAGKLPPAQRQAALDLAKTAVGRRHLQALYENAPPIIDPSAQPSARQSAPSSAPPGVDSLAYDLAGQKHPAHVIARRLKERDQEKTTP